MEALILVVTLDGPTMFARIGVMRALNRHVERVFDPIAQRQTLGRRKLKRNEAFPVALAGPEPDDCCAGYGQGAPRGSGMIRTANQCPLCCALRTQLGHRARSEKCHNGTHAPQQTSSLLNYPVGAYEQVRRRPSRANGCLPLGAPTQQPEGRCSNAKMRF